MTVPKIEVSILREGPVTLRVDQPCRDLDLDVNDFSFPGNLTGQIVFQLAQEEVIGRGEVRASTRTKCVRCLKEIEIEIRAPIELVYVHDPSLLESEIQVDAESHVYNYFNGEFIEPIHDIREMILIELPTNPLCVENCLGLCPVCGVNRNEKSCDCSTKQLDAKPEDASSSWKDQLRAIRPASEEDRKKS